MTPEDLDRAGRDIAELLKFLVAQMRSKGHEKATADFSVEPEGDEPYLFTVLLRTRGEEAFPRYGMSTPFAFCRGQTPTEAFDAASNAMRGMADSIGRQYAPYFDPSQNPSASGGAAEGGDGSVNDPPGEAVAADSFGDGSDIMKAIDAKRAAVLVEALSGLADLAKEAEREEPEGSYDYRAMLVSVENCDASGSTADGNIEIDLATARKLIPMLRDLFESELIALGVEP